MARPFMSMSVTCTSSTSVRVKVVTRDGVGETTFTAPRHDPAAADRYRVLLLDDADARGWKLRSERRQDNTAQDAGVTFVYLWQLKKGTALAATWAWPELDPVGA